MTTTIAVWNKSTRLSDADAALMTKACQYQMTYHVAPALGRKPWVVCFFNAGQTPPGSAVPIVILDNADQAGALGYHTEDDNGNPWGRVFVAPILDNGGKALIGALSVSAVLSHEVIETYADPNTNYWADCWDGTMTAYEMCDPVENDCYSVSVAPGLLSKKVAVSVSNFVTDEWFDPLAKHGISVLDYMGTTRGPLQMSPQGYVIKLNLKTGKVTSVFGSVRAEKLHHMKKPGPTPRSKQRANTENNQWRIRDAR